ncbi:abnormal spindle-like microcephaly-associated protein homolog [Schistocerca gregaria]|uniref:abnormal spindle-like microcephaly-associated protein homolog n=1 Tax=Schistocerca gregaria TaxID=7010 RepID=UPI00211F105D|nr:abnormal spindle-like microcephaly-associated protein homolog [Schistocerca gregaria]
MDVTLQAHEAKLVFPVPQGLKELASDISREVLREQPSNIYGFIADYCSALLRTRDNCLAAAQIVSQLLDRDVQFAAMLERKGLRIEDAHHAAVVIQSAYRGYKERQRVKSIDVAAHHTHVDSRKKAATVIQAAFRGYKSRKSLLPFDTEKYDVYRSPIIEALLLRTGHSWNEAQQAAMSIQHAYRAYKFRRAFAVEAEPPLKPLDVIQSIIDATHHTLSQASVAAISIQRIYRGHAARKYVKQLKTDVATDNLLNKHNITREQANVACILIQKIFRGYSARKAYKEMLQGKGE